MSDVSQSVTGALVGVSVTTSTTVATGVLDTISKYAPVIGLCLSLTSILLAVLFFTLNHKRDRQRQAIKICELEERIRENLREEIMQELKRNMD